MVKTALILLLGWFLGLISSEVIGWRKRKKEREDLKNGILNELDETKLRLAMLAYRMADHTKEINKEFLNWVKPHMENYEGSYQTVNISQLINKISELSDQQLSAYWALKSEEGVSLSVKAFSLPFLDSRISMLSLLKKSAQKRIIEIRAQVGILNEIIEEAKFYHEKTFDSNMSAENDVIVRTNLESCYRFIGKKARHLVDLFDGVIYELCNTRA